MSLECSLVVACPLNPVQLMKRALEWENMSPAPEILPNGVLVLDLRSQGFVIRADAGMQGYVEGSLSSSERWVWEPSAHVDATFVFKKDFAWGVARLNMFRIVASILETGPEDLAVLSNGDVVILRRVGGNLERFEAKGFWRTIDASKLPLLLQRG